jgi:glycine/serine hydroxymethyltransferase
MITIVDYIDRAILNNDNDKILNEIANSVKEMMKDRPLYNS